MLTVLIFTNLACLIIETSQTAFEKFIQVGMDLEKVQKQGRYNYRTMAEKENNKITLHLEKDTADVG